MKRRGFIKNLCKGLAVASIVPTALAARGKSIFDIKALKERRDYLISHPTEIRNLESYRMYWIDTTDYTNQPNVEACKGVKFESIEYEEL